MANNAPTSFGTAFAVAGFSFDANLSPNNQAFSNAALAVVFRNGQLVETTIQPFLPGGGTNATAVVLSTAVFANPTNKVSGTATNGTSTLAMRSDGAPALDWAQAPTWTGTHAFSAAPLAALFGTSTTYGWGTGGAGNIWGHAVQIGVAGGINYEVQTPTVRIWAGCYWNGTSAIFTGTGTANTGTSTGVALSIGAGQLLVQYAGAGTFKGTAAALTNIFSVSGTVSPVIRGFGPIATALVDMTPDIGTFTATLGAVTAAVNPVCFWARNGNIVVLAVGTGTGTSNANTFTLAGLPAAITPARIQRVEVPDFAIENSGAVGSITTDAEMIVPTNGTMTFLNGGTATGWGATLFKGVSSVFTVSYLLN